MIPENEQPTEKSYRKMKEDLGDLQRYIDDLTIFLPLAFCTVNPLHIVLGINQAFQSLAGYKEMEIIGNEIESLFLDKEEIKEFKERVLLKNERVTQEVILLTNRQEKIPVSISALARRDQDHNFLGYFLSIIDISESKKFQERLQQKVKEKTWELEEKAKEIAISRIALMNILEDTDLSWKKAEIEKDKTMAVIINFIDGLLFFNENNILDMVNPRAETFLKEDFQKMIGKNLEELRKNERLASLIEILLKNKSFSSQASASIDTSLSLKEEMEIAKGQTLEVSVVPVITGKNRVGTLVALHDISREKMIEAMKSEFVSIAAHQLRTPLSAIKWTMKMLIDGDLGSLNNEQKMLADKAYLSNERMVRLINDLLNVTRIEEGRHLYKPELMHIEDIINSLLDFYMAEIEKRGIKLKMDVPKEKTPTIAVDVEKITLVVQNLFDNAIKYTPKGGEVTLSVKHNSEINRVQVSISDSGVGIPNDQQGRIFTKFFRAANVIRMETEGSGLGLFICKNIVLAHGGDIWFKSEEGKGSIFSFNLPVTDKKEFDSFIKKL